jgi:hypothetical protein
MNSDAFVTDVSARINDLGWAYYFVPETLEKGRHSGSTDSGSTFWVGAGCWATWRLPL